MSRLLTGPRRRGGRGPTSLAGIAGAGAEGKALRVAGSARSRPPQPGGGVGGVSARLWFPASFAVPRSGTDASG